MEMTSPVRGRARRRWLWAGCLVLLFAAGLVAALPYVLSLPPVQRVLAAQANKILAPGSVAFDEIRLSWFQPTKIRNLTLHDAQGEKVVVANTATFGWSLWQILVSHPKDAKLTIPGGALDIERMADGKVDLYETLRPVISEFPPIRLKIEIADGSLRYRDPMFADPVVAKRAQFNLDLGRDHEPINWDIRLENDPAAAAIAALDLVGTYSRANVDPKGQHDLALKVKGTRWPWTLNHPRIQSEGELTGLIDGTMTMGQVRLTGEANITNLVAMGDLIASDTLHLDSVTGRLKISGGDDAWMVEQLELSSPIAKLAGQGAFPPAAANETWLEATADLAAVAKQLPTTLHLRSDLRVERGQAQLRAAGRRNQDGRTEDWSLSGKISDLAAKLGPKALAFDEPATLAARVHRDTTTLKLERLDVQSSFLTATGQGDLDRGIAVNATLDLAAFHERFRDWIDLGKVELAGQGKLEGLYKREAAGYRASLGAAFRNVRVAGLPGIDRLDREAVDLTATLTGRSSAAGWPLDWNEGSLRGKTGKAELVVNATAKSGGGDMAVTGRASTPLVISGREMRFEADVQVREKGGGWTTDRLALALLRASKWGPGIGPEEAIRWEGRGQYDPAADRLTVDSIPHPPAPRAESVTWIGGKQSVRIDGIQSPATARAELTAGGDVGTVVSWLSTEPAGLIGKYEAVVQARHDRDHWNIGSRLVLRDLARAGANNRPQELGGDVTAELSAVYAPDSDQVTLSELTLKLPNAVLAGSGTVRGLSGRPFVDLKGSLDLDWAALSAVFAEKVEPRARITGSPRAWKLAGTIDGIPDFDQMGSLKGDIGVQIDSVDVFGMRLGQTSLVVRSADGRLTIDPIDAKLNDGDVHLEPELVRAEDRSIWLHMGPESRLDGAVVNDEVSHRVLSYAAPVLDGATRVDGRVSLTLASAYVPISAGTGAQTDIRGDVLFDNMRFMPGPLAEQLLAVFNRDQKPLAVLREPVKVRVLGRKVYQQGLVIPVVNVASIGIDGSVDFDQNLDLVARFALVPPRGNIPVITPIMTNAHFDLPIRGTLKKPKIDGDALKERWKAVGTGLLSNSMEAGVDGLQRLLQGLPIPGLRGLAPRPRRATPPPPAPDAGQEPAPPGGGDIDNENNDARTQRETFKPAFRQNDRSLLPSKEERLKRKEARKQERLQKKADRQADRARDPQ